MINKIVAALLVLCLSACLTKQNTVTEEFSAGGLPFTLVHMPDNPRITIRIAWPSNWAGDSAGGSSDSSAVIKERNQAVPYIGTELLFAGGAEGYPVGELDKRFDEINTEAFLSATVGHILGTIHFSPEHQNESIKTANAHLKSPSLDEQRFAQARDQLARQLAGVGASAEAQGFDALRWALFGTQPIREALSLDGRSEVASVTQAEVVAWAKTVFKRTGATIAIAGDLNPDDAGAALDALFEGLPQGHSTEYQSATADFSARRILMHVPESTTSTLSFIGKLPPLTDFAELEDMLLTVAITEHWKNGLAEADDEQIPARYRFGADFSAFTYEHRFILLTGQVEISEVADAEKQLRKAYQAFRTNLPIEDLQKIKEPYSVEFKKYLKNSGSMSNSVLMAKLNGMDPARSLDFQEELDSISKQSLSQRLQTAFPGVDDFIVLVDSPDKTALPNACVISEPSEALDC